MKGIYQTSSIICGVNSTMEKIEKGQNENCRVFSVEDQKCVVNQPRFPPIITCDLSRLELLNTKGTIPPDDIEDYQVPSILTSYKIFADRDAESHCTVPRWFNVGGCQQS